VLTYAAYDAEVMTHAAEQMQRLEDSLGADPANAETLANLSSQVASEALETDIDALLKLEGTVLALPATGSTAADKCRCSTGDTCIRHVNQGFKSKFKYFPK
jgi:hypothetical protein